MLEKSPKQWHEKLSETLWAYRTSKREATGMIPYALTYGHDAILPMEIAVQSLRIAHQHCLLGEDYSQAMLLELEGLDTSRIDTINKLLAGKQAVSRAYNKRVKNKSFEEGEIVWKAILPLGTHIAGYGKWSPTWEVTNRIHRSSIGSEPKNLSHIQQSRSYWAQVEVESIAGRILETQGSSQKILIPVDGLLGQKYGIIYASSPPVSSISWKKPVNPVSPLDWTVPHLTRRERTAQILAVDTGELQCHL
ncbi:hypothetical protein L3X38_042355 [Prunus dulcis]|uniref:Uncharacterized protein n=1 Tax=Prunus dulcis TaxID=3755 RepID=A0AAD4UW50_PRUDU|nr:hypothetical protein L3X38_042355 [Prunus dulcis]